MKTDKEIKELAIQKLGYDCHEIIYNTFILAYKLGCDETKQNSHKHSVSGKQLPFEFVEWYSGMRKEKILRAYQRWEKEVACASGAVDTVAARGTCEHECTGPWDCQCQDVIDSFYRGVERKSSEGQL